MRNVRLTNEIYGTLYIASFRNISQVINEMNSTMNKHNANQPCP